jgi:thiol:disulfide interchange protein DsbD
MIKRLTYFLLLLLSMVSLNAKADPVTWSAEIKNSGTENPELVISATIAPGFHLYAPSSPEGGPVPLQFFFEDLKGVSLSGKPVANKAYSKEYNDVFEVDEHFFTGSVKFTQKLKPTAETFSLKVELKGQACQDGACMPLNFSKQLSGKAKLTGKEEPVTEEPAAEEETAEVAEEPDTAAVALPDSLASNQNMDNNLWENVEAEFSQYTENKGAENNSLLYIFIAGFIGGLLALVTPCVWPMIPMTMSFFLKQKKGSRKKSVMTASMYGLAIIVIYVSLGLIITALFGASALNDLATNAIFNIIFFLLLVVFAISFLGGFELTLPASWTNKMDAKVDATTGLISLFFMAFTLVLVSFSCTGPIIGTLLVEAASTNNFLSPAIGMFGFALALALPFTLFALFPSVLKSMPKSGGWLNSVKVVLGFLELALALKFLSVADLAYGWRILDREVFISLWIVIFALLGLYLLGKITFPHDDKVEKVGITRFMLACISLAFAVYMIPGLWGAPLKSISAFAPPAHTQDFSLFDGEVTAKTTDFETAISMARQQNKPILVDFSGHGCVNCRKMEAAVWTDPKVKSKIDNDFILVTLMVDEKQQLPAPMQVTERDGTVRTLRTVGDKWSYLQRYKFGANAQPYHVIIDTDGHPMAAPYSYDEDVAKYMKFLNEGVENFNNK